MPIDPISEELLTLSQAARSCLRRRQGKKVHRSSLYRWATVGSRGVVLETLQTPGGLCTSKEGLRRFFNQLTKTTPAVSQPCRPTPDGPRNEAVERELKARFGV